MIRRVVMASLITSLGWVSAVTAQAQEEKKEPATNASVVTEEPKSSSEEVIPMTGSDQASNLFRSICVGALNSRSDFVDLAINRGLTPVVTTEELTTSAPINTGDVVFVPSDNSGIELTVHGLERCAVWVKSTGSAALRRSLERMVNEYNTKGYDFKWVADRVIEKKDGARRQLRAEGIWPPTGKRIRLDAVLMNQDKRNGLQALSIQIDGGIVHPVVVTPQPAAVEPAPEKPKRARLNSMPPRREPVLPW